MQRVIATPFSDFLATIALISEAYIRSNVKWPSHQFFLIFAITINQYI